MLKINIEKALVGLGTLIFYMIFPFIWWWLILDKIPPKKEKCNDPAQLWRTWRMR